MTEGPKSVSELILIEPSKELETSAMQYRNDFIEHGETHINGSCGFIQYSDYQSCEAQVESE